VRRAA
jgi:hypothetical protein